MSQEQQEIAYPLSRCIACGCCLEACPQYTPPTTRRRRGHQPGAAFQRSPIGKALKPERLEIMMDEGGVTDCGKAGNCSEVCPKDIPLLESIAAVQRQATVYAIKSFFTK